MTSALKWSGLGVRASRAIVDGIRLSRRNGLAACPLRMAVHAAGLIGCSTVDSSPMQLIGVERLGKAVVRARPAP